MQLERLIESYPEFSEAIEGLSCLHLWYPEATSLLEYLRENTERRINHVLFSIYSPLC